MATREALQVPGLLIAEPGLEDPNFYRSVVALITHNPEGSFGIVLNRLVNVRLMDVLEEYQDFEVGETGIRLGGPVEQNRLFTLHSGGPEVPSSPYAVKLSPDLVFEPDFSLVDQMIRGQQASPEHCHFYLGYSGWGPGQLDMEFRERTWIPSLVQSQVAFGLPGQEMWKTALSRKGPYYDMIAQTEYIPSLN